MSVVPQLGALLCLVNKVASTSLLDTLLKLAGHGVPVYNQNLSSPHTHAEVLRPKVSEGNTRSISPKLREYS